MSQPQAPPPVELKDMSPLEDVDDNGTVADVMRGVSENASAATVKRVEDIQVRNTPAKQQPALPPAATPQPVAAPARELQRTNSVRSVESSSTATAAASNSVNSAQAARMLYLQQQAALQSVRGEFDFLAVPDWVQLHPLLGAYLAEGLGTFAFVLSVALVQINNPILGTLINTNVTCLPIGMMMMCMVFTFGYISGGHFNPAITIAVALARRIDLKRAVGYIICQTGAAFGAGIVAMIIQGSDNISVPTVSSSYVLSSSMFAELIYTFAVATVVLNVAYSKQKGNFFYGFAIGMTVCAGVAGVGSISGGAFNPALATGLQLALCMTGSCSAIKNFWLYWVSPVFGACLASLLFSQIRQPDDSHALADEDV
mmetsp:Transcript_72471/g.84177  ORF Transcript_72471/g.84177 Transcript_72471/m.84177 type:complete len:371 (+) Transcript_72471:86-1198(+)